MRLADFLLLPIFLTSCSALPTVCLYVPDTAPDFDTLFTGKTLRFDWYHSGTATEEHVSPSRCRVEGDWPGSRVHLVHETNFGKTRFPVVDPVLHATIWSRGFSSIYGEWETTGEAKTSWRTFHESQRFPEPKAPVQLVLEK